MSPILCQYTFKEKAYNNLPVGLASCAQEHTHLLRTQVAQFYTNGQQSETLHRNKQSESHFSMAMSFATSYIFTGLDHIAEWPLLRNSLCTTNCQACSLLDQLRRQAPQPQISVIPS